MRWTLGVAWFCVGLFLVWGAQGATVEIEPRYWLGDLSLDGRVDDGGIRGTTISAEDDLGLDTTEPVLTLDVVAHLGERFSLYGGMWSADFDGDALVHDTFVFSGERFRVNTRVTSAMSVEAVEVGAMWKVVAEPLALSGIVGAQFFQFDAEVEAPDEDVSATGEFELPLPSLGVLAKWTDPTEEISLSARLSGTIVGSDTYSDLTLEFEYRPLENLAGVVGYRTISVDVEEDEVFVDGSLDGLFLGAKILF